MNEPKVSVVIPNYNAEKYVKACLDSIIQQHYENLEIIVVDDGSTDNSIVELSKYCDFHKEVHLICQENMNASIARNVGLSLCTGEYVLFLDSDDILYPNALKKIISKAKETKADIVIGNYDKINENGQVLMPCIAVKNEITSVNCLDFCTQVPNPSNKLYRMDIIRKNVLVWGNVRIGQDLNFFLKYLACASKISLITENIYGWREVHSSMSNTFSFRIFDITESFMDTRRFYNKIGMDNIYANYIEPIEYRHYYLQMEKQKKFSDKKVRKIIINYFAYYLMSMDIYDRKNYICVSSDVKKCKVKLYFRHIYGSSFYTWLDRIFARK